VRKQGPPSEVRRLGAPFLRVVDGAWQRMHWWIGAMAALYLLSGITIVKPDEVAVILRWGRLVGATPALQEHGPGLLFALPEPIDKVVRVQTKKISALDVRTLIASPGDEEEEPSADSLTPLQGYAITGDNNIVQLEMVARYRVSSPAEWALYGPPSGLIVDVEVTAAMVRSLGEAPVDSVLADGRKKLIATASRRAQAGLDGAHAGLELTSLELTHLSPPQALTAEFDAVQSAFIGAETRKKEAQAYAETTIPQARAAADQEVQEANATSAGDLAQATGAAAAFRALAKEYRANPVVARERLYRDGVEKAIGEAGSMRWVPPPKNGRYIGFRITIGGSGKDASSGFLGEDR
jgi:membrane protease subunit HflK